MMSEPCLTGWTGKEQVQEVAGRLVSVLDLFVCGRC